VFLIIIYFILFFEYFFLFMDYFFFLFSNCLGYLYDNLKLFANVKSNTSFLFFFFFKSLDSTQVQVGT
jgi:hypothetical protein